MTRAAYMALSTAEREQLDVTALGAVAPRGVPKPVEMYQLDAVPGRTFAALRLGREENIAEDNMDDDDSSSEHVSGCSTLSGTALFTVFVLRMVYGVFPPAQRIKLLLPLFQRWCVCVPPRSDPVGEDTYSNDLIRVLSLRVGRVMERKLIVGGLGLFSPVSTDISFCFTGSMFCEDQSGFEGYGFRNRSFATQTFSVDISTPL
ncbi:putative receptor-type adenylate cyclase [Trypanosoma theileri]|uniref:Putative receptor-type adenylate cyclase n=1 Tax=Trypanosoma theileri TaxID=67003 RepID=A0A1X0NH66_9TRYP|nr:putative receptor-type adenylate cyclase [Trypanosoma theileri]ORC83529.1 putative receptor-type adenylate cyclase [Trypanosoma theileri]